MSNVIKLITFFLYLHFIKILTNNNYMIYIHFAHIKYITQCNEDS